MMVPCFGLSWLTRPLSSSSPDDAFGGMTLDVDDRKINIRERYAKGC
ncbi:MAG: hypothetical protein K0R13_1908 [Propionibacteriaceae bacterium]|nr:hypothetical protein [Propionibacteriaceae bacterium]